MKTIMSAEKGDFTYHKDMTLHANSKLRSGVGRRR
jgi:hypothetical protein